MCYFFLFPTKVFICGYKIKHGLIKHTGYLLFILYYNHTSAKANNFRILKEILFISVM